MNLQWLTIELTTKCDLRCDHCFALAALESKNSISLDQAKLIATEGILAGFKKLHLTGGEVTLWKDFFSLVDFAFRIGYQSLFFNTHGGHLTREFCSKVASYGDKISLTISLNGNSEIHDASRGEGSYDSAIQGIQNAQEFGLSVEIFAVVGKRLLPLLPEFAHSLFSRFPKLHRLTLIQLHRVEDDFYDVSEDLLTPQDFISMIRSAAMLALYGYPIYILDNSLSNVVAQEIGLPYLPYSPNIEGEGRFVVLVDEKITNSHSSRAEYGYFKSGIFQEILGSESYKERTRDDDSICPTCNFLNQCRRAGNPRPSLPYMDDSKELYCKRVLSLLQEEMSIERT
ncbi:radical SAM protein [Leptospira semungkisensis]|uniref:Radical SAM protein n=1 Tax=Leptospira semungkisensis TaxID=2484985 RepID=A0A4R9G5X7_9LEPT|nr:radical SAM protein [Leptospira semungkisensis]TGK06585.1 radical SAM protein [Leptospira semungkisensis]